MKLDGLFESQSILLNVDPDGVEDLFFTMVEAMDDVENFSNVEVNEIVDALVQREEEGTTGIGDGVAIPHAKMEDLDEIAGAFARTSRGINFRAVDGEAVDLFFLVVAPENQAEKQLEALRKITKAIRNHSNLCSFLRQAETKQDVLEVFRETEDTLPA